MRRIGASVATLVVGFAGSAASEPRAVHGSVGGGGALLFAGEDGGARLRVEGEVDVEPGGWAGRFGGLLALRAADRTHHGLLVAGLMFEAAAARPRLVLGLHADLGIDLDVVAPVVGGGLRATVAIWRSLGVAIDTGAHLVVDGIADTRLVFGSSTSVVVRW
ncbi:MAG: hypothetical protein NT062_17095 [Proteobacteria bacterium]|nr:hypothetical protein [Pseudomonadota bacterium]